MFLGGLHGLPPQRQINGLQRCNSLLCGCQIAVHRLRQLSADGVRGSAVQRHGRCGVRGCGLNGQRGGGGGSRAGGLRHGGSTRKRLGAGHGVRNGVHGSVLLVETLKPPAPRFQARSRWTGC